MAHMFFLSARDIDRIQRCYRDKQHWHYIVLDSNKSANFVDIAEYDSKYDTVKLICIDPRRLDEEKRLPY